MSGWDPDEPPRGPTRGGAAAPGGGGPGRTRRSPASRPTPPPSEAPTEPIAVVGRGDASRTPPARARAGRSTRKRGRRRNARVLIVIGVILLPFLIAGAWFAYQLRPGSNGPEVIVTVKDGMGTSEIADLLVEKDVIGSGLAFKLWSTISGGGPYQQGCHTLREGQGIRGAVSALEQTGGAKIDGRCVLATEKPDLELFLPPARRLDQIAQVVSEVTGRDPQAFIDVVNSGTIRSRYQPPEVTSLDGFLFPDTYRIRPEATDEEIVQRLVDRFDEIGDKVGLANAQGLTPYQVIVAASLIQTEAKLAEDGPLISAVIRNRLNQGMPLQIDATLCRARFEATGTGCPPVPTDADKEISSPYNTYQVAGLPPTPIASLTEAALVAALTPADVPYLYYVLAEENGKHAFATTLEEHNRNVEAARAKGLL